MPTFEDDLSTDLDEIFRTDGSGFARSATLRRVDTGATFAVDLYPLELLYSVFDPRNQIRFFIRKDQVTGYQPRPNDKVEDTGPKGTGFTFSILNVLEEEGIYNITAQRMDARQ